MSTKFLLKWDNHMNIMNEFKQLLSLGIMVDVTLACDGQSLKAHKIILSACSSFFKTLFLENPCKHPIVILKDIEYTELKAIIDFMYCGEVSVAENQLSSLVKAAKTLRIKGLGEAIDPVPQNDEFDNESQNSSDTEFAYPSPRISKNYPGDNTGNQSFCISDIQPEAPRQKESVIEQNDNGHSASETVTIPITSIKQEVCDDMEDTILHSNASMEPFKFPKIKLLKQDSEQEQSFQDSASNLESQVFEIPELDQNHSNNSSALVSEASTSVPIDAIVTDNQQPSTSSTSSKRTSKMSASSKRPSKMPVHEPLQKKVKIKKNSSRKPIKRLHNLRTPEVLFISDSTSTKVHDKNKDSARASKEMKFHECKICPFKTVCPKSLRSHINSRHHETRKFKCDQCAFVTYGKSKFKRHSAVHERERPYHCSLCTYKFTRNSDLKKHVKKIHKLDTLIFKCQKCNFIASTQESIQKHEIEVHVVPTVVINKLSEVTDMLPEATDTLPEATDTLPEVTEMLPEKV